MAWFGSASSFQATCINSLARALSEKSSDQTGKVTPLRSASLISSVEGTFINLQWCVNVNVIGTKYPWYCV